MADRISSLDNGYEEGDLSYFPAAIDDKTSLYQATNNSETTLKQSLLFSSSVIIVNDNTNFPATGLLRIGPPPGTAGESEFIYYGVKGVGFFKDLIRGFANTRRTTWPTSSYVTNSVMAEHHNAIKDALINIQKKLGVKTSPADGSMTAMLNDLEIKFLSPKPAFRAFPKKGPAPLTVTFQNYSLGENIRYVWDFGDGTSIDESPTHTFTQEGIYSVKLNVVTENGGQGIITKKNYIIVSNDDVQPFFYVTQKDPDVQAYSQETADAESTDPCTFLFVDQTEGDIAQRYWLFGDGEKENVTNPQQHTITHIYETPGTYTPSLLLIYSDSTSKRAFLSNTVEVI
jgi:PKD repeat protein